MLRCLCKKAVVFSVAALATVAMVGDAGAIHPRGARVRPRLPGYGNQLPKRYLEAFGVKVTPVASGALVFDVTPNSIAATSGAEVGNPDPVGLDPGDIVL